ncbi:YDG/SRA domain-containing protein [Actinomadura sp. 21ATH]|uniref:caspase, EACC1-associated type n=1 Tax=Actinomadura sp. 21ATH TaxID=1735444 RepID=UPI0035C13E8C
MSQPDPKKSRAVLIGTAEYEHMHPLPAVTRNVRTLGQELIRHEVWGLPPQHCTVLENPADIRAMVAPIQQAADEASEVLLVYFAGHGVLDQNSDLHLGLPGTADEPAHNYYTAVPYDHIRTAVRTSRAQCRIVILDCCFSGRAIDTMGPSDLSAQTNIEGSYTITSAPPNSFSLAPEGAEFTAFTQELIEVVRNGIADAGTLLTMDQVFERIHDEMQAKGRPRPWCQDRNDAGRVRLFKNRARTSLEAPPGYGEIPGYGIGSLFKSRRELHEAKVHRPTQAGICGRHANGGAESIVLSGGYPDDEDHGDVIVYTGHGGQDSNHRQIRDQDPTHPGNAALLASITTRYPVRVIRGAKGDKEHSPEAGYRYDGLYTVERYWNAIGIDGFRILQFRLEKLDQVDSPTVPTDSPLQRPGIDLYRWEPVGRGVYGDRRVAQDVMQAHNYECQICGTALQTPAGFRFAQTLHLQGLPRPHRGPDISENILCVCPTHRVQLELGMVTIDDSLTVIDEVTGKPFADLSVNAKHSVGLEYVRYHRGLYRGSARPGQGGSPA